MLEILYKYSPTCIEENTHTLKKKKSKELPGKFYSSTPFAQHAFSVGISLRVIFTMIRD